MTDKLPDGERWLNLLGYDHLKGTPTGHEIDGQPVLAEEFNTLCDDHVRPVFTALEMMSPDDPKYPVYIAIAQKAFQSRFNLTTTSE